MNKKRMGIFTILISTIIILGLLVINGSQHNVLGLKLFTNEKSITLAYKTDSKVNQTVFIYENDRYIEAITDLDGKTAILGTLKYPIDKSTSYSKLVSLKYTHASMLLLLFVGLIYGKGKYEKHKQK
ncbi:MAG: hypothetical protein GX038_02230 [Erysipelothrix sp.]|nr:hypothetical protein [Erysipelothrix sp.]